MSEICTKEAILATHTIEIEGIKDRVKSCEKRQSEIATLTSSVEKLAINMGYMATEQKKQGERLEKLEKEPYEAYKSLRRQIIGYILTGIAGAVLSVVIGLLSK